MADIYDTIAAWLTQYWPVVAIIALAVILIRIFYKPGKEQLKPIARAEVERRAFLKRMSFNDSRQYKRLLSDSKPKYSILKIQASEKDGVKIIEMVLKPLLLGVLPWGQENGYVFRDDNLTTDPVRQDALALKDGVTAWNRSGIFLDNSFSKDLIKYFQREYTAQTDLETLSSEYYAMGQENSVIQPDRAHATLDRHLEIERIKEERKKQQLGS